MYCYIYAAEGAGKTIETLKSQIVQKSGLSAELVDAFFTNKTVNVNHADEIFISGNDNGYVVIRKEFDYLGNSLNADEISAFDKNGVIIDRPKIPSIVNAISVVDGEEQEFYQFFVMGLGYCENLYVSSANGSNKHMYYTVDTSMYAFIDADTQVFALVE